LVQVTLRVLLAVVLTAVKGTAPRLTLLAVTTQAFCTVADARNAALPALRVFGPLVQEPGGVLVFVL